MDKRFVSFQDDGTIYKISKNIDERYKFLEVDFEDVRDFIEGKKSLLQHKVEYDFVDKKYIIKSQQQVDEDKLMWSFIYEVPTEQPKDNQLVITRDKNKKVWRLVVDQNFEKELAEQNISVDISKYYFSITKKHDPNVLYKLIRFTEGNEIPFTDDFEFDDTEVSVYTIRRFDTYYHEEVNG
jgi:hypothetical protein